MHGARTQNYSSFDLATRVTDGKWNGINSLSMEMRFCYMVRDIK
jgi:hypothetical protein